MLRDLKPQHFPRNLIAVYRTKPTGNMEMLFVLMMGRDLCEN